MDINDSSCLCTLTGIPASKGISFGYISFLQENICPIEKTIISNVQEQLDRFHKAKELAIDELNKLYEQSLEKLGEQNAFIFQIHQMMLEDPDYISQIENMIKDQSVNAEYAIDTIAKSFAHNFMQMDNEYMQGRANDVIDVSKRLIQILLRLSGISTKEYIKQSKEPIILATDDLTPSQTAQLNLQKVSAIITSQGSNRSHTVIFAKTMGLAAVISIGSKLNESLEGKFAIVDGSLGKIFIEPCQKLIDEYSQKKKAHDALRVKLEQYRGKKTITASGKEIELYANIGSLDDLDLVIASDAQGIGLFRSEYIYLSTSNYPTEDEQFEIYKQVLCAMKGKKVIIRTLDIGADKSADYFLLKHEENPAMGLRAVRLCLNRPKIFKTQLKALYRASVFGNLSIMFPMINSKEEVLECKKICQEVQDSLERENIKFNKVPIGIMVETPACALIADDLAEHVDFFSIGTNDLTQFTLAVDRQNADCNKYLNPYHKGILKLIDMTVKAGHKHNIWVGVCGELAGDENITKELIEMGVDELSVVPSNVLLIRSKIAMVG